MHSAGKFRNIAAMLGVEIARLRSNTVAKLIHQQPPALAVASERLRLPSAAVEREHQLPPRLLAQRLLLDERLQLADETLVLAELELRFDPLAERLQPQLGQPPRRRDRERLAPELVQRSSAPERERVAVELSAPPGIRLAARRLGQRLEQGQIRSGSPQDVTGRARELRRERRIELGLREDGDRIEAGAQVFPV